MVSRLTMEAWVRRPDVAVPSDERDLRRIIPKLPQLWKRYIALRQARQSWRIPADAPDELLQAVQRTDDVLSELRITFVRARNEVERGLGDAKARGLITEEERIEARNYLFGNGYPSTLGVAPLALIVLGAIVFAIVVFAGGAINISKLTGLLDKATEFMTTVPPVIKSWDSAVNAREPDGRIARDAAGNPTGSPTLTAAANAAGKAAGAAGTAAAVGGGLVLLLAAGGLLWWLSKKSKKGGRQ
jgi:hypothetical protein